MNIDSTPERTKVRSIISDKLRLQAEDELFATVEMDDRDIGITVQGYEYPLVMIEKWDGELRVVVYADKDTEEPSHIIPLEGVAVT